MCTEQWLVALCLEVHITVLREVALVLQTCTSKIDLDSSFVRNGGDSLACIELQSALRRKGIEISFETIITVKSVYQLLQYVATTVNNKKNTMLRKRRLSIVTVTPHERRNKRVRKLSVAFVSTESQTALAPPRLPSRLFPMTRLQLAFVQSSLKDPLKNVIQYHETHHSQNMIELKKAWHSVIESEPIFRTHFYVAEGNGYMVETNAPNFEWNEVTVGSSNEYENELGRTDWKNSLDEGYPVNSVKVVTWGKRSTIIWRVHHALIDEHSRNLLMSQIRQQLRGNVHTPRPSFVEFASQLCSFQCRCQDLSEAYWTEQKRLFASAVMSPLLPVPCNDSINVLQHHEIDVDVARLAALCKRSNITLSSLYYAAWGIVLSRYTDSDAVYFGVVFSGRGLPIPQFEDTIGPTINVLPLCVTVNREMKVEPWLHHIFDRVAKLFSLQWSVPCSEGSRFDTALNVQVTAHSTRSEPYDPIEVPFSTVVSDIPLQVDIARNGRIRFSYHTEKYSATQIKTIADVFATTLEMLQWSPGATNGATVQHCLNNSISKDHSEQLSRMGNWSSPTTYAGSVETDLVQLFITAATSNPDSIAISQGTCNMTYSQLHRRSAVVAKRLKGFIKAGDVVCVHADRTLEWIVAIYGIIKAGGVYCPLAEDLPSVVRAANYEAADAKVFLIGTTNEKMKKPDTCKRCLSVEEILADTTENNIDDAVVKIAPEAPAYLCFTSGSTGKPKGVLCRHAGLVAFQSDLEVRLFARPGWRIAQIMAPNFDGSIHEIFSALSYGAELILKDWEYPLANLKAADAAILTPSVAKVLDPEDYPNLKVVYFVGEAVPQAVNDMWTSSKTVYNMYGPTEATCGATIKQLKPQVPVAIGSPNRTTRIYILDEHLQVAPPGRIGEIYLAGVQVAVGYVGRPEETASRFLPDSIHPHLNELMYKTGDQGYWNESGDLMFIGRNDRQIKHRGFRIDMNDLEARILNCFPSVKDVAVALKDNDLVAQIQPADINMANFNACLKQHVPKYALPRYILPVNEFPLTPIGKLDYKNIAAHDYSDEITTIPVRQMSRTEAFVTSVIREELGLSEKDPVDLDSNIANLGGHSLLHVQLSRKLSRYAGRPVPYRLILQAPSLLDIAKSIDVLRNGQEILPGLGTPVVDEHRLSPIEMDWWVKNQKGGSTSFNVSCVWQIGPELDVERLTQAWNTVLERHKILRCYFSPCKIFGARREFHPHAPRAELRSAINVQHEIHVPIDIQKDLLFRILVSPTQILAVVSHIICDLTTFRFLMKEVSLLYLGRTLAPIGKVYSQVDWTIPQHSPDLAFWSTSLAHLKPTPLPVGKDQSRTTWNGTSHVYQMPPGIYKRIQELSKAQKVTMHQFALAAMALVLQQQNDNCDIVLQAPHFNRKSEEDLSVVGLFLQPIPIRIRYDTDRSDEETFLQSVQRSSREAISHAVPWNQLLSHLDITPDYPNHPISDFMVTFHDKGDGLDFGLPGTTSEIPWTEGAKFKLMAEFSVSPDENVSLRFEYSTECFDAEDVKTLAMLVSTALDALASGEGYVSVRDRLRA